MAYATGISNSITDLVSAIKDFAVTQGYTLGPTWQVAGTQPMYCTYIRRDGFFYHLSWYVAAGGQILALDLADGSNSAGSIQSQPGSLAATSNNSQAQFYTPIAYPIQGPHVGYHLFSDGGAIHCVVERVSGVFVHLSFGQLVRAGNYDGGQYVEASAWYQSNPFGVPGGALPLWNEPYHCRPFEGLNNSAIGGFQFGNGTGYPRGGNVRTPNMPRVMANTADKNPLSSTTVLRGAWSCWSWGFALLEDSPNQFNSRAALVPAELVVASTSGNTPTSWSQFGQLTNVAAVNMSNIDPKDMVNTDWMVFPLSQKNGPGLLAVNSGNYGLAYKK